MKPAIPYFIINPTSGGGRGRGVWKRLVPRISRAFGSFEFAFTRSAGDAAHKARRAAKNGFRFLIAVGGDGTLHEVLNGVLEKEKESRVGLRLGLIPVGSGDDFKRSLGWGSDPEAALRRLKRGQTRRIDVGRVVFRGHGGKTETKYFLNIADFGLGGTVMRSVNASKKYLGSKLTYLFHGFKSLVTFKTFPLVLKTPDKTLHFPDTVMGIVANGRFFGSGLGVAPEARLDDGLFDVVMVEKLGVGDLLQLLPKLYRGELFESKKVFRVKTPFLEVMGLTRSPVYLDLDGEQPGTIPATFEIIPQSLSFCV